MQCDGWGIGYEGGNGGGIGYDGYGGIPEFMWGGGCRTDSYFFFLGLLLSIWSGVAMVERIWKQSRSFWIIIRWIKARVWWYEINLPPMCGERLVFNLDFLKKNEDWYDGDRLDLFKWLEM